MTLSLITSLAYCIRGLSVCGVRLSAQTANRKPQTAFVIVAIIFFSFIASAAHAGVILKLTAKNPSEFEERQVTVKSYLPAGIKPENIIDKGGLEVAYDTAQGQYYVYKETALAPLETATYQIEVQDIWEIDEKELNELKSHSKELAGKLKNSEYSNVAEKLNAEVDNNIELILEKQKVMGIGKANAVEHINAYELNKEVFNSIKSDVGTMENLVIGLGGDVGKVLGESYIGAKALDETVSEAEKSIKAKEDEIRGSRQNTGGQAGGKTAKIKTIVLKIEVTNSSKTERRSIPVMYYLPREVRKDDIIDAKELEPRFNFEKSLYYLYHPGVELGPGESRVFEAVVKDKWSVSETKLLTLKLHTAAIVASLEGSKEFGAIEEIGKRVIKKIDGVLNKKTSSSPGDGNIADFRAEQNEVAEIEKEIGRMEALLRQAGAAPKVTALDQGKLKQLAEASGVREERLKQIQDLLIEGKSDYGAGPDDKGLKLLAGTVFKGRAPSKTTTWKIIYIILGILGVVSVVFYFSQIEQQQIAMFDALTGAFTRKYIMERFKEELKIARGSGTKCSLLFLDIDRFKKINDTYGHAIGDTILKEFVIAIRKGIRATDLVGRFGGDEFLVILPIVEKEKAREIAEGIRNLIEQHNIKIEGKTFKITSSIGVTTYPVDSMTAEDMLNKADKAMYEAKTKGGNAASILSLH